MEGYMRFSPNGEYLAIAYQGLQTKLKFSNLIMKLVLFPMLFHLIALKILLVWSFHQTIQNYMSAIDYSNPGIPDTLFQLNISNYNYSDILNSKTTL